MVNEVFEVTSKPYGKYMQFFWDAPCHVRISNLKERGRLVCKPNARFVKNIFNDILVHNLYSCDITLFHSLNIKEGA
jgi:hypothetical protein